MSESIVLSSQLKKPFHQRNGSGELDVFEASGYFSGVTENLRDTQKNLSNYAQKYSMKPIRRISLDMPNHVRGNSSPLQTRLVENPMMTNKEKKFKQPSSPGGKLAHFLNSLFNQTSSKKSKSKKKSTKDEDHESPGGWKRKRRSSISHFTSGNNNSTITTTTTVGTTTVMSDDKSSFSTSTTSSGFRTPPPYHVANTPAKTKSYIDAISFSYLKPPLSQITKTPITENLNNIKSFNVKSDLPEKNMSFRNGFMEKVKSILEEKQDEHDQYPYKYGSSEDIKEFKKFNDGDDGADSDSSSDLFELTNCDLGYYSNVYKTTHMDSIKIQERCTNVELSV